MSISALFRLGNRALFASEAAMQVAGHNVANAGTPGFHRTRLVLGADSFVTGGLRITGGAFSGGVGVRGYERVRDALLERSAWQAQSGLGAADEEVRLGYALEGLLGLGDTGGLQDTFTGFWDAWASAADAPTDLGARTALLGQAGALATALHDRDDALNAFEADTRRGLGADVDAVNGLVGRIAELNAACRTATAAGAPDFAAEDERERLLDELAAYVPADVAVAEDGTYTVTVQGMALVQGDRASGLVWEGPPDAAADALRFAGTNVTFAPGGDGTGGRLGGTLRTLTEAVPESRAALDGLAARLVADVNAIHAAAYGLDGSTGRPFFDPAGVTAGSIALAPELAGDPAAIAFAGSPDNPGDASAALAVAALAPAFDAELAAFTASIGGRVHRATVAADGNAALAAHFDGLVASVSAVSLDEETARLIEYQQTYAAAARIIETAQAMMDTLLAL